MMRTVLVMPPVWQPEVPYLSVPALAGYLRSRLKHIDVRICDLNLAFWRELRGEVNLSRVWTWAGRRVRECPPAATDAQLATNLFLSRIRSLPLEQFQAQVRGGHIRRSTLDECLKLHFREEWLCRPPLTAARQWEEEYDYHDPLYGAISLSEAATSGDAIRAALEDTTNPYVRLLPALYLQSVGRQAPDLLGISITAVNQVIPGFALARWAKTEWPACRIVVGGAWGTHLSDATQALGPLFTWIDALVVGEGERPLAEIAARVAEGRPLDEIPGVLTGRGGAVARSETALDNLPAPDFDGFDLAAYDYPGMLPLQASRGCSWGRCTFCSYVTLDPVYRTRAVEKVAADVEALVARHNAREIAFTDSLMQPAYFRDLAAELLRRRARIKWRGFGRFDKNFDASTLETMARAGCHYVIWGMESASPRVLKLMRKGNNPDIIHNNLRDAARAGIHNRTCLIYGYPGETREDRAGTLDFLRRRKSWVHSIAFCHYTAVRDTAMTREPRRYGLVEELRAAPLALETAAAPLDTVYLLETEQLLRRLRLEIDRHHRAWIS